MNVFDSAYKTGIQRLELVEKRLRLFQDMMDRFHTEVETLLQRKVSVTLEVDSSTTGGSHGRPTPAVFAAGLRYRPLTRYAIVARNRVSGMEEDNAEGVDLSDEKHQKTALFGYARPPLRCHTLGYIRLSRFVSPLHLTLGETDFELGLDESHDDRDIMTLLGELLSDPINVAALNRLMEIADSTDHSHHR